MAQAADLHAADENDAGEATGYSEMADGRFERVREPRDFQRLFTMAG